MDGWITIGTELSTDKFDGQIIQLEKKVKKEEEKSIRIQTQQQNIEKQINDYDKLLKKAKEYKAAIEEGQRIQLTRMYSGKAIDPKVAESLKQTTAEYSKISQYLDTNKSKIEKLKQVSDQLSAKNKEIADNVKKYKQRIEGIKLQKQQSQLQQMGNNVKSVGNSLKKAVKQAGMMALSILGIRSALNFLKSAPSDLASYNEQYATDLEYIKFALTQALAPALQYILSLASQLLGYVNAIASAWFGLNIFGNASVNDFMQMKKSAGGVAAAVKEIKKQLAGFDEMNVLSEDKSSGGGSGGGSVAPSFDLSGLDTDLPDWLQWIIDHGDVVARIIEAIGSAFLALKFGLDLVQGAGLFLIIEGFRELVKDIQEFVENPTITKIGGIIQDIGMIVLGLSLLLGLTSPVGVFLAVLGQVLLVIGGIFGWFEKLYNFITNPSWDTFLEFWRQGIKSMGIVGILIDWLVDLIVNQVFGGWEELADFLEEISGWVYDNVIKPIAEYFAPFVTFITETIGMLWNDIMTILSPVINFFKGIFDTIWKNLQVIINNIKQIVQVVWTKVQETFKPTIDFFRNIFNTIWGNLSVIIDNAVKIFTFVRDKIHEFFGPVAEFLGNVFTNAIERIKSVFSPIIGFFKGIWDKIMEIFGPIGAKIGEVIGGAFRRIVNATLGAVERILNTPIRAINRLTSVINQVPGINLGYLSTFDLPRLKTGGIINMPNTGTLVGSAIAGESGREGVIPLTDSQAMAELGREIGRYITVNANIVNTMNGRVISRELKQIQNEQSFAYNT